MKIIALAATALAATIAVAPATAQTRVVTTTHTESHTRTGPAFGGHHRTRQVCRVTYRHHQKVRSCRTVRY